VGATIAKAMKQKMLTENEKQERAILTAACAQLCGAFPGVESMPGAFGLCEAR